MDQPPDADQERRQRRKRVTFAVVATVFLFAVLYAFQAVLRPFILGALLAYVLHPVVAAVTRVRIAGRAMPRWVAVVLIYVSLITGLVLAVGAIAPRVAREVRDFVRYEVPELKRRSSETWLPKVRDWTRRAADIMGPVRAPNAQAPNDDDTPPDHALRIERANNGDYRVVIPPEGIEFEEVAERHYRVTTPQARARMEARNDYARQLRALGSGHVLDIVRVGGGIIGGVIGGIFGFFMTMMVSAYMLVTEAEIFAFARSLVPPGARGGFDGLLRRLDKGLVGVVRGQLIICMVNGCLSAVGFALADLKYWPTLALVAAIFSLIPIFGSILSSVPAVAIGLTQGFGTGLFVLLWILGIHQLEANLLNPKIMGDAAKIHPVLVVFSLLAGEHFFGILGALLAVPAMSIVQSLFLHWRQYALDYDESPAVWPDG